MNRDRLLRDLRWLAEGNPRYAGTDEEGKQNPTVAHFSRNVSGAVPTPAAKNSRRVSSRPGGRPPPEVFPAPAPGGRSSGGCPVELSCTRVLVTSTGPSSA